MSESNTNRIEKRAVLRAPRSRVWRAIANAEEFGVWIGVKFDGAFAEGATMNGIITDPPGYEHLKFEVFIERIQPESLFSYRWHPYAIDPEVDYSQEPTTLVEFRLEEADGGTQLTIVEDGFDAIPLERRADALRMNDGGWAEQAERVKRYVERE